MISTGTADSTLMDMPMDAIRAATASIPSTYIAGYVEDRHPIDFGEMDRAEVVFIIAKGFVQLEHMRAMDAIVEEARLLDEELGKLRGKRQAAKTKRRIASLERRLSWMPKRAAKLVRQTPPLAALEMLEITMNPKKRANALALADGGTTVKNAASSWYPRRSRRGEAWFRSRQWWAHCSARSSVLRPELSLSCTPSSAPSHRPVRQRWRLSSVTEILSAGVAMIAGMTSAARRLPHGICSELAFRMLIRRPT